MVAQLQIETYTEVQYVKQVKKTYFDLGGVVQNPLPIPHNHYCHL